MSADAGTHTAHIKDYDAWLFDLDGVVTDTASVHGEAWKETFDEYLEKVAKRDNVPFEPFQMDPDYFVYVDGKPRYNGVDSFLRSRGIELPWGTPDDSPDLETVCGVGNRKNQLFNEVMKKHGPEVFDSTVALIRALRAKDVKIAVVSSSKNCTTVLKYSGLTDLFDEQVDGIVAAEENMAGKPDPETYLQAAKRLGVTAERSVVIEDAISGVEAGRSGAFGLVIGIARHDEPQALLDAGAHVVVQDMAELTLAD